MLFTNVGEFSGKVFWSLFSVPHFRAIRVIVDFEST